MEDDGVLVEEVPSAASVAETLNGLSKFPLVPTRTHLCLRPKRLDLTGLADSSGSHMQIEAAEKVCKAELGAAPAL